MNMINTRILVPLLAAAGALCAVAPSHAQVPAISAPASGIPADPWPRVVDLSEGQVLVYQPQINAWKDNQLDFRAAMAFKKDGAKDETFGTITASARTQVDKAMRTGEGTTIWYLRVIHHIAQNGEVWTLDIKGEEWGEVDFPEDVENAETLAKRWDESRKARAA